MTNYRKTVRFGRLHVRSYWDVLAMEIFQLTLKLAIFAGFATWFLFNVVLGGSEPIWFYALLAMATGFVLGVIRGPGSVRVAIERSTPDPASLILRFQRRLMEEGNYEPVEVSEMHWKLDKGLTFGGGLSAGPNQSNSHRLSRDAHCEGRERYDRWPVRYRSRPYVRATSPISRLTSRFARCEWVADATHDRSASAAYW
jgi:hypothetical protein